MRGTRSALAAIIAILSATTAAAQDAPATSGPRVIVNSDPIPNVDTLIGENRQPEWTAHRRFPTTRVYVLSPWQVEFEQWWKGKFPREGKPEHLFQSEIEIGLPYRFQLDLYENVENASGGGTRHAGNQVEARWAFAEWGRIPLNPTLYVEWRFNNSAADAYEVKASARRAVGPALAVGIQPFLRTRDRWGARDRVGFQPGRGLFPAGEQIQRRPRDEFRTNERESFARRGRN